MEKSKNQVKKKERDPLETLKFKGYCWARTPPGDKTTIEDLTNFAKFFLCKQSGKLWKDPVWDSYTDEEILIEYFAHLFSKDEKARTDFEAQIDTASVDFEEDYAWLDRMVKQNQEENQEKLEKLPDKISFEPGKTDVEE